MSSIETLRMNMDTLQLELQGLQVENSRLRDEWPEKAADVDATAKIERYQLERTLDAEVQELRQLLHQSQEKEAEAVREAQTARDRSAALERQLEQEVNQNAQMTSEVQQLTAQCKELESCGYRWEREAKQERSRAELERYRAVEAERRKWEAREERLLAQLEEVKSRQPTASPADATSLDPEMSPHTEHTGGESVEGRGTSVASQGGNFWTPRQSISFQADQMPGTPARLEHMNLSTSVSLHQSALSAALLAHQLPPIGKFSGETSPAEKETFEAWKEQFEMVAFVSCWDPPTKLVNLTTRLRGQAYAFYQSCSPQQRSDYELLVAELTKRFTPVRLQSVQSSMFHDKKQKPQESVDAYAQDLRRLFHLAYLKARQGSEETESMGRSVLAYQFVAGLIPGIKLKLAGLEGSMDELLVEARLQEAKLRDLVEQAPRAVPPKKPYVPPSQHRPSYPRERGQMSSNTLESQARSKPSFKCFHCQGTGHIARNCPMQGRAAPAESRGRYQGMVQVDVTPRKVATITINSENPPAEKRQKQENK